MKTRWLSALLLGSCVAAHADRDIVYAARYYTPPGSHRTSHFHIYRINPDGTGRRQLTFGTTEDGDPRWSPNGKLIAFTREPSSENSENSVLCFIGADGGGVTTIAVSAELLAWSPDSSLLACSNGTFEKPATCLVSAVTHKVIQRFAGVLDFIWFPNGHHAYLASEAGSEILDLRTGKTHPVKNTLSNALKSPVGLGQYIVGYTIDEKAQTYLLHSLNSEGRDINQVKIKFPKILPNGEEVAYSYSGNALFSIPSNRQQLVYALYDHISSGDNWYYSRLNTVDGTMHHITQGAFLAWSPNEKYFCTSPRQSTTFYTKRRYPEQAWEKDEPKDFRIMEKYRMVWFAPLYVRVAAGGPMKQITPRLSYVTGADWRKVK